MDDGGQIPLLESVEGVVSDAGGEVQKTGGLMETTIEGQWIHCAEHSLNLCSEKSCTHDLVAKKIRSISSFTRSFNKHDALSDAMRYIQDPKQCPEGMASTLRH